MHRRTLNIEYQTGEGGGGNKRKVNLEGDTSGFGQVTDKSEGQAVEPGTVLQQPDTAMMTPLRHLSICQAKLLQAQ